MLRFAQEADGRGTAAGTGESMKTLLVANLSATLVLVGLIWTIQIVHYPLFLRVGAQEWAQFHAEHSARITLLVGPLMLAEVALALWLGMVTPPERRILAWVCARLVGLAIHCPFERAPAQPPE